MREKRKKHSKLENDLKNGENKDKLKKNIKENIMEEGPIKINHNFSFPTYEKYENMLIGIKIEEVNIKGEFQKIPLISKLRETYKERYYRMLSLIYEELLKEKKELSKEEKEIISYFFSNIGLSKEEDQEQKLKFLKALLQKREELKKEEIKDLIIQAKSLENKQNIETKSLYLDLTGLVSAKYFKPQHLNLIKEIADEGIFEGNEIIRVLLLSKDMLSSKTTSSYFLESLSFLVELTTIKITFPNSTKKLIPPNKVGKIILDYNTAFIPTMMKGEYAIKEIIPYPIMENIHSLILSLREEGIELLSYLAKTKLKNRENKELIFLIHQINEEGGKERVSLFFDKIKELREVFGNPIKKNYLSLLVELYEKYKEEGKDASSKLIEDLKSLKTLNMN